MSLASMPRGDTEPERRTSRAVLLDREIVREARMPPPLLGFARIPPGILIRRAVFEGWLYPKTPVIKQNLSSNSACY